MLRRYRNRRLADINQRLLNARLDNIARLLDEIRALPEGASAKELTAKLLNEAEEVDLRALCVDQFAAKATRTA